MPDKDRNKRRPKDRRSAPRAPSAADVAALAGVSRSAVSRTFTDGASVSPQTRAKVLKAAERLNYHVNHLARGLSKQESRPVCILVSTLRKPYHAELLDRITTELQDAGRIAIVINVGDQPDQAERALEQTLNYRAAASVVLSGSPPAHLVKRCVDAGQDVILVNRADVLPGVHHIQIAYETAMKQAAQMFVRAGCTRVALVTREIRTPSLRAREEHFVDAMHALGHEPQIWRGSSTTYETGQQAARELLVATEHPDGICCINDLMACGVLDVAMREFGYSVPSQLSVLGFDNILQSGWSAYQLTTFAQPYAQIADAIVKHLHRGETEADQTDTLAVQLIWRNTMRVSQETRPPAD